MSRLQVRFAIGSCCALLLLSVRDAAADGAITYRPGHRFVRAYLEDNRELGAIGVDIGWNAYWSDDLIVAPSTGLRLIGRHQTNQPIFGWTAAIQLAGTTPVAPYLEIGFDAGEALGELVIDHVGQNDAKNWIDPDTYAATGFQLKLSDEWVGTLYYKRHYVKGAEDRLSDGTEVLGFSITRRFARRVLEWWQRPP